MNIKKLKLKLSTVKMLPEFVIVSVKPKWQLPHPHWALSEIKLPPHPEKRDYPEI